VWIAVARGSRQVILELGARFLEPRGEIQYGGRVNGFYFFLMHPLAVGRGAVWAIDSAGGSVWRIDPRSHAKRRLGAGLDAVSLAVGGRALWVAGSSGVTKIDPVSGVVIDSAPVGPQTFSERASVAVGAGAVWYAASSTTLLSKVDPQLVQRSDSLTVGRGASGLSVKDGTVWVANSRDGTVTRIDPGGRSRTITLGHTPGDVVAAYDAVWTSPSVSRS